MELLLTSCHLPSPTSKPHDALSTTQFRRRRTTLHIARCSAATSSSGIESACLDGNVDDALDAILDLEKRGFAPDPNWFSSLLQSCASSKSLLSLQKLHNHLTKSPFVAPAVIRDAMVVLYCKLGSKRDALRAVEELCNVALHTRGGRAYDPKRKEVYQKVIELHGQLREAGYVPDTRFVLHDIDEEAKERALMYHSERLAIAYGLINTPPSTTLRIMKNLRICGDCHNAVKIMSRVVEREIVVRDNKRFHHFRDGACSCGDYW